MEPSRKTAFPEERPGNFEKNGNVSPGKYVLGLATLGSELPGLRLRRWLSVWPPHPPTGEKRKLPSDAMS